MTQPTGNLSRLEGGGDKPRWAPGWAPTSTSLDYLAKLATVVLLILGSLYFFGFTSLKPFAQQHVAAV